jgi:hypothetical protein
MIRIVISTRLSLILNLLHWEILKNFAKYNIYFYLSLAQKSRIILTKIEMWFFSFFYKIDSCLDRLLWNYHTLSFLIFSMFQCSLKYSSSTKKITLTTKKQKIIKKLLTNKLIYFVHLHLYVYIVIFLTI